MLVQYVYYQLNQMQCFTSPKPYCNCCKIKGFYGGQLNKDLYDHIRNFLDVCNSFTFKNVSQDSIHLRLFLFSLTDEASKWLAELPAESIAYWDELRDDFIERFFPLSRILKLRIASKTSKE